MDLPTNTPTTSSSDGTASDLTESFSSVVLLSSSEEPTGITDLPSEIILQIYTYLYGPSEIASLNSTSRKHNWVWRVNTASISNTVLSRSIDCYNSALEVFEVEERVKQIHCIILPHSVSLKRMHVAQNQARHAVLQRRRNDRWEHISRAAIYRGILHRNHELLSVARDTSYVLGLIKNRVVCSGVTPPSDFDRRIAPPDQDIVVAYHDLSILIRLRYLEAMETRLKNICRARIRNMLYVATYFVCDCPDKDKIRLSISRKVALRHIPWGWASDDRDLAFFPRCHVIVHARRAFFAVADAVGEARIPDYLLDNRSACHGDCEDFGRVEAE